MSNLPILIKVEAIPNKNSPDTVERYKFRIKGGVVDSGEEFCWFIYSKYNVRINTDTLYRRLAKYKQRANSLDGISLNDLLVTHRNGITYKGYNYESLKTLLSVKFPGLDYRKFLNTKHRLKRENPNLSGDDLIDSTINSLNVG